MLSNTGSLLPLTYKEKIIQRIICLFFTRGSYFKNFSVVVLYNSSDH